MRVTSSSKHINIFLAATGSRAVHESSPGWCRIELKCPGATWLEPEATRVTARGSNQDSALALKQFRAITACSRFPLCDLALSIWVLALGDG